MCHRKKSHGVLPSSSSSDTPFDTSSSTPSDTTFNTLADTKIVDELAVVISTTCVSKINDMGFSHGRGIQLLSS